jgi:hypothetical protein
VQIVLYLGNKFIDSAFSEVVEHGWGVVEMEMYELLIEDVNNIGIFAFFEDRPK